MTAPRYATPLSAFIICKDERANLGDCLQSLAGIDEIVIVDSGSTDGTLDLIEDFRARGFPIRLVRREWPGFARQKQFALEQCRNDWCINLDADERLSDELRTSIAALVPVADGVAAYSFRRVDWLPGYGYAHPAVHARYHPRIFRRDRVRYMLDLLIHEGLHYDGRVEKIAAGRLLHFRNLSLTEEMHKAAAYATLKARERFSGGRRAGLLSVALKPLARFLKSYVLQRYFLCGVPGLVYAKLLGNYVFLTEAKLYRMARPDTPDETA